MRRRDVMRLSVLMVASPLAACAQLVRKIPRVGIPWHAGSAEQESDYLPVLTSEFNKLGYVEGKNIGLIHRFPAEQPDRVQQVRTRICRRESDAIIAVTPLGAKEAKQATSTMPIVRPRWRWPG
jgi:putative tryptophan/tyrosine transport system substrate-binding protein